MVEEEAKKPPTFTELVEDFGRLLSIESLVGIESGESPGGHNPAWTIRTAEAIRIIREERAKVRRELRRTRNAELEAEIQRLRHG